MAFSAQACPPFYHVADSRFCTLLSTRTDRAWRSKESADYSKNDVRHLLENRTNAINATGSLIASVDRLALTNNQFMLIYILK